MEMGKRKTIILTLDALSKRQYGMWKETREGKEAQASTATFRVSSEQCAHCGVLQSRENVQEGTYPGSEGGASRGAGVVQNINV